MSCLVFASNGGKDIILDLISSQNVSRKDKMYLNVVLKALTEDGINAIPKLVHRPFVKEKSIWEIKKASWRLVYTVHNGEIYIIHIFYKQSNKALQKDINLAKQRMRYVQSNKKNFIVLDKR